MPRPLLLPLLPALLPALLLALALLLPGPALAQDPSRPPLPAPVQDPGRNPGRDTAKAAHAALLEGDAARALELAGQALDSGSLDREDTAVTLKVRGAARHALGDPQAALADYSRALALFPHYAEAFVNRAAAWFDLGDPQAALADLDQALRLKPDSALALFNRARVREALADAPGAVRDYNGALLLEPDNPPALVARARLLAALGAPDLALADYDRAAALAPDAAEPFLGRGGLRLRQGDLDAAERDFRRAAGLAPDLAAPHQGLARAAQARGCLKTAEAELDAALALDPGLGSAYNDRGALRELRGSTREALEDYTRAVDLARTPQAAAAALANRGLAMQRKGHLTEAAMDLAKAASLVPGSARFHAQHGAILLAAGDPAAAEADFTRALGLPEPPEDTRSLRAQARRQTGDLAGAEADLTACLDASRNRDTAQHRDATRDRGLLRLAAGRPAEAAADLRLAARPSRPDAAILLHLADTEAGGQGCPDILRKALKRRPGEWPAPVLRFLLAEIPARDLMDAAGQDRKAAPERAAQAAVAVSRALLRAGQHVEAVRALREAAPAAPPASPWTALLNADLRRLGF